MDTMKKSFANVAALLIGLAALMASCYPGGPEFVEDYDVVYTFNLNQDVSGDPSKTVYFLPDTIVDLSDPESSPPPKGNEAQILNEIRIKMAEQGYVEETDTSKVFETDFIVLCSVTRSNNYYYTWWGGWSGWPGWGWGGCCYYPPVTTVSNYRTGSLLLQFVDTENVEEDEEVIPIVWQGTLDGLFEGSSSNITNRAKKGIDQMFEQSPYLKRN
jgi:hypothetical protein